MKAATILFPARHIVSRILHAYADFRIGATEAEKRCYKPSKSVLLTFDDYGSAQQVHEILTILQNKKVKAMFFLQGDWANDNPKLVADIRKAGHVLGNHTFSHAVLRDLPEAAIEREITTGLPGPWLRPPEGRYNKRVRAIAKQLGYVICYWTIDSRDWTGMSAAEMRHVILNEMHPGAVVLFHLHGKHTRELLPGLIDDIRVRGLELTKPDETWQPYL